MQWVPTSLGYSMDAKLSLGNRYATQALNNLISLRLQSLQIDTSYQDFAIEVAGQHNAQQRLFQQFEQLALLQPRTSEENLKLWEAVGWSSLRGSFITGAGFSIQQVGQGEVPPSPFSQDLIYAWCLPYYRANSLNEVSYNSSGGVSGAIWSRIQEIFSVSEDDVEVRSRFLVGTVIQRYPKGSLTGTPADYYEQTNCRSAIVVYDMYGGRLEQITEFEYGILSKGAFMNPTNFSDQLSSVRRSVFVMAIGKASPPSFNYPLGI